MGLDMYLNVGKGDHAFEIGYWRKANAIHKYFVDTLQDGDDDQRESPVDLETFEDLFEKVSVIREEYIKINSCIDSLEKLTEEELEAYSAEEFENSWNKNEDSWNYVNEDSKNKFAELCEKTLPTTSGFFFGNTKYDFYYIYNIIYTYDLIKEILDDWETNLEEDNDYYYTCWW